MSFGDLLKPKPHRWPKRDDLPLRKAKSLHAGAPLSSDGLERAVSMMDGFMLAGATLARQASNEKFQRYDLVYPMLFCYRHAIEAGLKWIITQYGPTVNSRPDYVNSSHDLWRLWQDCARIHQMCEANFDHAATEVVGQIIKQFHNWDKGGMIFRYSTAKDGAVVKFQHPSIDIDNLMDVMSGLANFFHGTDGWLDAATCA
jgi:hypothetical protein